MSVLNLIQFEDDGTVLIRWKKDDGGWHRTAIPPNVDPDFQLDAVAADLQVKGMPTANTAAIHTAVKNIVNVSKGQATKVFDPNPKLPGLGAK